MDVENVIALSGDPLKITLPVKATCRTQKPPVSQATLAAFERRFGELPTDYREFIMLHNGVEFHTAVAAIERPAGMDYAGVEHILGIQNLGHLADSEFPSDLFGLDFLKDSLPIADDGCGNFYLMRLSGGQRGYIYFFDHELSSYRSFEDLEICFTSFTSLVESILDHNPEDNESREYFEKAVERDKEHERKRQAIIDRARKPSRPWWKFWG